MCHRPSSQNTNADALSSREDNYMLAPTAEEEDQQSEYVNHLCQLGSSHHPFRQLAMAQPVAR